MHNLLKDLLQNLLKKTPMAGLAFAIMTLPVFADSEYLEVDDFSGLEVGTGMIATIVCGSENTVTLNGDKLVLDKTKVVVRNGYLDISRSTSAGSIFKKIFSSDDSSNSSDTQVKVDIVTTGTLSSIEGSTGSSLKVDGCSIDSSSLQIEAGTGASIQISGMTENLSLEMSTGSTFNKREGGFTVGTAEVEMSTGSSANLCGASTIIGSASTGATIKAGESADTSDVSLSFGADVRKSSCR